MYDQVLRIWGSEHKKGKMIHNVFAKIVKTSDQKLQRFAFKKLLEFSFITHCSSTLQARRTHRRVLLFFDQLRTRMIYARIIKSYAEARKVNYSRKVLHALLLNRDERILNQSKVELHVSSIQDQSN